MFDYGLTTTGTVCTSTGTVVVVDAIAVLSVRGWTDVVWVAGPVCVTWVTGTTTAGVAGATGVETDAALLLRFSSIFNSAGMSILTSTVFLPVLVVARSFLATADTSEPGLLVLATVETVVPWLALTVLALVADLVCLAVVALAGAVFCVVVLVVVVVTFVAA